MSMRIGVMLNQNLLLLVVMVNVYNNFKYVNHYETYFLDLFIKNGIIFQLASKQIPRSFIFVCKIYKMHYL